MALSEPPRSREATLSPGDTAPGSLHLGAYLDGRLAGVCSVGPEPLPILDHPNAWRVRGLIMLPEFRGRGIGSALMQRALAHVETQANPLAWGFPKKKLTDMYSRIGFRPTGYTYVHTVGGNTLLFGNAHTLRLIQDATGITYTDGDLPCLGAIEQQGNTVTASTSSRAPPE
jgi:GNAT superfamily N-acetyltransferase